MPCPCKDKMKYGKLIYPVEEKAKSPKWRKFIIVVFLLLLGVTVFVKVVRAETLTASWYSVESLKKEGTWKHSKGVMANGKLFNENAFTCASRDFPLKAKLRVTNLKNPDKSVVVEVTDRVGKRFASTRIDLSKRAFSEIADLKQGLVQVKVEVIR